MTNNNYRHSIFQPESTNAYLADTEPATHDYEPDFSTNILGSAEGDFSSNVSSQMFQKSEERASDAEVIYPNEHYREQVLRTGKPVQISKDLQQSEYHLKAAETVNMQHFPYEYHNGTLYADTKAKAKNPILAPNSQILSIQQPDNSQFMTSSSPNFTNSSSLKAAERHPDLTPQGCVDRL